MLRFKNIRTYLVLSIACLATLYFSFSYDLFYKLEHMKPSHSVNTFLRHTTEATQRFSSAYLKHERTLSSTWIRYFPAIKSMLLKIPEKNVQEFNSSTCSHCSVLYIKPGKYFKGAKLEATIEARDYYYDRKQYGGDYFRAILRRPGKELDGISCDIEDLMNGNYSVSCELLWTGKAQLFVSLMHPSEAVYYLIANTSFSTSGVSYETTFVNSMGKEEKSTCALSFVGIYNSSQLCNYSHPKNGEPWFCVKPPSGECNPYKWQVNSNDVHIIKNVGNNSYYNPKTNWHVRISGSHNPIDVLAPLNEDAKVVDGNLRSCENQTSIDLRPSFPTGWINDGKWESLLCKNSRFDIDERKLCLKNHIIYFIGDSTIRLWFEEAQRDFQAQDISTNKIEPAVWSRSRKYLAKDHNITIYYMAHGPPLRNPGPPTSRPYVSDTLENIKVGGKETILFFSIGFHFQVFTPDVLIRRIRVVKRAFSDLKTRLPEVRIFVKGFHSHTETKAVIPTDWLSYRFDVILRREFQGFPGITFLNTWDVSVVLKNPLIHPSGALQKKYSDIFLSYVC